MKKLFTLCLLSFSIIFLNFPAQNSQINSVYAQAQTKSQSPDEMVVFNQNTHKMHKPDCKWAIKCKKSCIAIKRQEAIKRGGIPCKTCGG